MNETIVLVSDCGDMEMLSGMLNEMVELYLAKKARELKDLEDLSKLSYKVGKSVTVTGVCATQVKVKSERAKAIELRTFLAPRSVDCDNSDMNE